MRFYKLLYETFLILAWKCVLPWLKLNHHDETLHFNLTIDQVDELCDNLCQDVFVEILDSSSVQLVAELLVYDQYQNHLLRQNVRDLVYFCVSYFNIADIMFNIMGEKEEGNITLCLSAVYAMTQWCFEYNKLIIKIMRAICQAIMRK